MCGYFFILTKCGEQNHLQKVPLLFDIPQTLLPLSGLLNSLPGFTTIATLQLAIVVNALYSGQQSFKQLYFKNGLRAIWKNNFRIFGTSLLWLIVNLVSGTFEVLIKSGQTVIKILYSGEQRWIKCLGPLSI